MKIDRDSISSVFSSFNDTLIFKMISDYYEGTRVTQIIKDNKIKGVSEKSFVKSLPRLIFNDKCENCGGEMRTILLSRTGEYRTQDICLNCGLITNDAHEEINNLIPVKTAKKLILENYSSTSENDIEYGDLSVREKTILSAILWQTKNQGEIIGPLGNKFDVLCNENESYNLLKTLIHKGILQTSPSSDTRAFVFDNKQEPTQYYMNKVKYIVNLEGPYDDLFFPKLNNNAENTLGFYECWIELGTSIIHRVVREHLRDINVDFDKLDLLVKRALTKLSIGSLITLSKEAVYEFSWRKSKNSKTEFSDVYINHFDESMVEKRNVRVDGEAEQYSHNYWYDILFYKVTSLGEGGYTMIPNKNVEFFS